MAAIGGALGSAHWFRASVPFNYWGHECSGLQVGQGTCQGVTYGRDFPTISANYKWLHSVFRPRAPQIRCSWLLSLHPVERNHGGETLVEKHSWGKRFSGEALVEKNFDGEAFRWRSTLEEKHSGGWRDIALAKLSWGRNHVGEKKMPWSKCASYFWSKFFFA